MARPRKNGLGFNGRKAALEQEMKTLRQEHRDWMADVLEEYGLDKWSEEDLDAALSKLAETQLPLEAPVRRKKERAEKTEKVDPAPESVTEQPFQHAA